jgi:hypothetical protein
MRFTRESVGNVCAATCKMLARPLSCVRPCKRPSLVKCKQALSTNNVKALISTAVTTVTYCQWRLVFC